MATRSAAYMRRIDTPDRLQYSQGDGDAGFVGNNKLFAFSTAVFTSWDFHLTDWEAASNLRSSIRVQVPLQLTVRQCTAGPSTSGRWFLCDPTLCPAECC